MAIKRIKDFPEGSGTLSDDDIFVFMDDPSGASVTKKISLSQISDSIVAKVVDFAPSTLDTLNEIAAAINDNANFFNAVAYSGDNISKFVNDVNYSVSGHTHTSSNITDFNSSVSGLLPTVSNSGDNRVLTSTGSSTGANAESNMTFDGSALVVNGTAKFNQLYPTVSGLGNVTGTVNTNATVAQVFNMTLTGSITLANPSSGVDGVTLRWRILQDNVGGRGVTLGNKFVIPSTATNPLPFSTSANAMDVLAATYHAARDKWDIIAFVPGY